MEGELELRAVCRVTAGGGNEEAVSDAAGDGRTGIGGRADAMLRRDIDMEEKLEIC